MKNKIFLLLILLSFTGLVFANGVPTTTWDANESVWYNTDVNVHLTCVNNGLGCGGGIIYGGLDLKATTLWVVTSDGLNKLYKINTATNSIDLNISLPDDGEGIGVDNSGNAWVASYDGNLYGVSKDTNSIFSTIAVGGSLKSISIGPDNNGWGMG